MAFRLRLISFMANGRRLVRDRDLDKDVLTVGRATDNDVNLPDLGVDPYHARIIAQTNSRVTVESISGLGFSLDGRTVQTANVDCRTGAELAFGYYRLKLGQDGDGVLLVEVQDSAGGSEHADPIEQKRAFAITRVMPGKRAAAWIVALLVLGLFLVWPIATNRIHAQAPPAQAIAATGAGHINADRSWNAGELSQAHHALTNNCEACHVKPFQAVQDTTCIGCHRDVHDHAPAARQVAAMGPPSVGGAVLQRVAHAFGQPGPGACVDCHVEHKGAGAMQATKQQFCTNCHAGLNERLPDTKLANAGDFAKLHPQFQPAVVSNADTRATTRVSLDAHPREDSGLVFSHADHLDTLGGVAKMAMTLKAQGYGKALGCADCHHPSEDGVRFQTVSMERDCEACHSLVYDRVNGVDRKLRHGDVQQMIVDLNAVGRPAGFSSARQRPGEFAASGPYQASFSSLGSPVARAMAPNGLCGECHVPETRNGKLAVKPVTLVARYMQHGWFDHSAHSQTACSECHAAATSRSSADVLLPGIKTCRDCHVGETASPLVASTKVSSSCAMCHSYHTSPTAAPRRFGSGPPEEPAVTTKQTAASTPRELLPAQVWPMTWTKR